MRRALFTGFAAAALIGAGARATAADLTWADQPMASGSPFGHYRSSLPLGEMHSKISFGFERYRALAPDFLPDVPAAGGLERGPQAPAGALHVFSGFTLEQPPSYLAPPTLPADPAADGSAGRLTLLGATWSRRLGRGNTFGLSAGYAEFAHPESGQDMFDTRAALSWSSRWPRGWRPGVTGSVFLGDETARDSEARGLGRRYYGFSVGGEVTLFEHHTPYLTYRLQRSLLEGGPETAGFENRAADHSLLSAGWRWQVLRNWSLQAEATYALGDAGLDLYNEDRARVIFGTRFDFR